MEIPFLTFLFPLHLHVNWRDNIDQSTKVSFIIHLGRNTTQHSQQTNKQFSIDSVWGDEKQELRKQISIHMLAGGETKEILQY